MKESNENKPANKQSNLTTKLAELIQEKTEDNPEKSKANIVKISTILRHSKEMQDVGINDENFIVDFNKGIEHASIHHSLLGFAVVHNKLEVVKLLIQAGMDPNYRGGVVGSLWVAAYYNRLEILKNLVDSGGNIHLTTGQKESSYPTILHTAATTNHYDIIFFLLLNNALEIMNKDGKKPSDLTKDQFIINLFNSASFLHSAIKNLKSDKENIFSVNAEILSALRMDADFVLAYLTKVAHAAVLRGQGLEHEETFYNAELVLILKLVIKELKTLVKIFPELLTEELNQKYLNDLLIELNAYDPNSTHFDDSEKIFKSIEEKNKTLKWLETHLSFAKTKSKMKEGIPSPASLIASSVASPIFGSSNNNNNDQIQATKEEENSKLSNSN